METGIKKYVSRYVVPFYFDYENNGYTKIINFFRNNKVNNKAMGLPNDGKWVEKGFWENYKFEDDTQPEMDIYTYLLKILREYPAESHRFGTNIGASFVYKSNGSLLNLEYRLEDKSESNEKDKTIGFRCKDLGVLVYKNGIGFIWYGIDFSKEVEVPEYVHFQHDFKELARTHSEKVMKKTGKDEYEPFCLGKWLTKILNTDELGIRFWAERVIKNDSADKDVPIPDKALLFQYLFIESAENQERYDLAFQIANGYDDKYISPSTLRADSYEPFGNTCFYTSKTGTAYVVTNNESNEKFFMDNFKDRFIRDYFFIYVLLLYQTYSCAHYSRLLTKLPADASSFEIDVSYVEKLESLDSQIDLFLVKSVYESISNIQHQNGTYKYGKKALCIEDDIKSLTVGLNALRGIEKDKHQTIKLEKEKEEQECENRKDRALNKGLVVFGFLVVVSAAIDAVDFVDWFCDEETVVNTAHILSLVGIGVLTVFMFVVLIVNSSRKKK